MDMERPQEGEVKIPNEDIVRTVIPIMCDQLAQRMHHIDPGTDWHALLQQVSDETNDENWRVTASTLDAMCTARGLKITITIAAQ